jgi:DNA processing protein
VSYRQLLARFGTAGAALDALRAGGVVWPSAPAGEIGQRIERAVAAVRKAGAR